MERKKREVEGKERERWKKGERREEGRERERERSLISFFV